MNINKTSWHYAIASKGPHEHSSVPANLCPYMRRVVVTLAIYILLLVCATGTVPTAYMLFTYGPASEWPEISSLLFSLWTMGGFLGLIILAVVALLGCAFAIDHFIVTPYKEAKRERARVALESGQLSELREPEPSIISAWLKAKHDKICPQLEFVGDK